MYLAVKAREVGHHPTWTSGGSASGSRSPPMTPGTGSPTTDLDFTMARHIDAIAAGRGAEPVPAGES
jgi:4a-hydroxytetrahydrobiopterin dehydratase